ncbi:MAG: hypothetical protein HOV77_19540 [Hamadaea sp.]|uniref:hypothetical protein n=1 Tax=Hamadaea sp. TaxID=2024425 RepID=UPI0017C11464|nr:hypothetical protein [Hamadaea sp.]NUT21373.1 hypothetical protein [Hamadaea sp.]
MEWFGNFFAAATSGLILGLAYGKREVIGRVASRRVSWAAGLALFNALVIGSLRGFVNDMVDDWTALGEHVPASWTFAQNLLEMASGVLYPVAFLLLASALLAPRADTAERPADLGR